MSDDPPDLNVVEMAAEIVSAYVRNNSVPVGDLPTLLQSVHDSLGTIVHGAKPEAVKEAPQPKVPIKRSITNDYLICLEDGKRFKSLKRHLHSAYGLSPQEYREKWGLPKDYPMVAPAYADARSNLAKSMGLGRKAGAAAAASPAVETESASEAEVPEGVEKSGAESAEATAAPELDLADGPEATEAREPAEASGAPAPEPAKKPRGRRKASA